MKNLLNRTQLTVALEVFVLEVFGEEFQLLVVPQTNEPVGSGHDVNEILIFYCDAHSETRDGCSHAFQVSV